ncbi:hypothetical protein JCM9140_493 [Halalkalibacter wakoensis JCM 9140]|uniref:Uncharacterized protein n=1 Tax=Halalkalibacter wakoensis JCM 9140 TaxID=1236970 RepID=W4PY03_9BACI|nr:CBO0543 family protein [Halalkalibacter wakoensis]GAE24555.1 hypothetical protein JCM9140_493 [Halalkalibacter wakoensis JCM 9140]
MNRVEERLFLYVTSVVAAVLLPFAIIKKPLKDWIIVYLVSCIGNSYADRFLVSKGYLEYKVKPFSKKVPIHLPFDFLIYPLLLLYFNQWTLHSKPAGLLGKLFILVIPQVIIETIAEKKTNLISWKNGWSGTHSFISLLVKFLMCRFIISIIRKVNTKQLSVQD